VAELPNRRRGQACQNGFQIRPRLDAQTLASGRDAKEHRCCLASARCPNTQPILASYSYLLHLAFGHYERVVIGRYGHRPRPKGFTSQLNEALMAHLDIGQDHLRTLRKALAAFKRGVPHTDRWTR